MDASLPSNTPPCEHPQCVACLDSGCKCWESATPKSPGIETATLLAVRAWPGVRDQVVTQVRLALGKAGHGRREAIRNAVERQHAEFKLALCAVLDEALSAGVP